MNQLQEVLLVQLLRSHGAGDYARIATALKQHPLLTLQEESSVDWTPDTCKSAYERICEREVVVNDGNNQTVSSTLVNDVWQLIYPRYIAWLKKQIRDDEEQYETLRMLTEKSTDVKTNSDAEGVSEVPSSTQDTAEERLPTKRATKGSSRAPNKRGRETIAIDEKVTEEQEDNDVEMTHEDDDQQKEEENIDAPGLRDADQEESTTKSEEGVAEQVSVAGSSNGATAEELSDEVVTVEITPDLPEASESGSLAELENDGASDEGADEIAVAFVENDGKTTSVTQDAEPSAPTPRVTRTRSSTINTVASDVAMTDEQTSPQVPLKKRAGRPSKKQLIKEESVANTPEEIQSVDDPDTAAAIKRFQSTIMPVLGSITSHRYASVFGNPVSDKDAPNYSRVVKWPMDLKTLRMQIKSGEIGNVVSFQAAIFRMLSNAVVYNSEGSEVASMAQELFDHVEEAISLYKAAEEYAEPVDDRTPKRRRRNEA